MKKLFIAITTTIIMFSAYADVVESIPLTQKMESSTATPRQFVNGNAKFISNTAYIQNPYAGATSGGGTLIPSESGQNVWEKWFANGTYNVYSGISTGEGATKRTGLAGDTSVYGSSAFAQTGQAAGFSFGIAGTVMNPFLSSNINGKNVNGNLLTPGNQQIAITQGFAEYQYSNILNADIGLISINNSPWLSGAYFNDEISIPVTYQGALVNIYAGNGWLLTTLAFNGIQTSGQNGYTTQTLLNSKFGTYYQTVDAPSSYTAALGAGYNGWNDNFNLHIWGYQFENLGTLGYIDSSLKIPLNEKVKLKLAAQGGINNNFGATTAYTNNQNSPYNPGSGWNPQMYGNINSNFIGGLASITLYDFFKLELSADTIWGPNNSVGSGAIVSPYTANLGADPLYAEGWLTDLVDLGLTGNIYKVGTTFTMLKGNISISPNYVTLQSANQAWNNTKEGYITAGYSIPQVRGLYFYGIYAMQWLPAANPIEGLSQWTTEALVSYLW